MNKFVLYVEKEKQYENIPECIIKFFIYTYYTIK